MGARSERRNHRVGFLGTIKTVWDASDSVLEAFADVIRLLVVFPVVILPDYAAFCHTEALVAFQPKKAAQRRPTFP